jgi:microcystin-dependent protein
VSLLSYVKTVWNNDLPPDIEAATLNNIEDGVFNVTEEVRLLAAPGDGKIVFYPVTAGAEPSGWLLCDGRSVLRADYPDLFTAIGVTYGSVDSTHFNLPPTPGRTLVGAGTGVGLTARTLGASGGEEDHVLTIAEMPAHNHGGATGSHSHGMAHDHTLQMAASAGGNAFAQFSGGTVVDRGGGGASTPIKTFSGNTAGSTASISSQGGGGAHNNMQPFLVVNYLIKT